MLCLFGAELALMLDGRLQLGGRQPDRISWADSGRVGLLVDAHCESGRFVRSDRLELNRSVRRQALASIIPDLDERRQIPSLLALAVSRSVGRIDRLGDNTLKT